jgi:hypothetical protein
LLAMVTGRPDEIAWTSSSHDSTRAIFLINKEQVLFN